ncbi:MAG: hypothetical protein JWP87_5590 [Labilithrix sp.]|nr:hypothetical protein [Labilithrix sp.]
MRAADDAGERRGEDEEASGSEHAASILAVVPDDHVTQAGESGGEFELDEAAIARLKLAAEEVAWLTGRGYALDVVGDIVAKHHALSPVHCAALACGTCSEPQYRRRAARELEPEDVAKRPLAIDAIDCVSAVEAALAGRHVLQTLDGTVRAFGIDRAGYVTGANVDDAIDRLLAAAKELRPSVLKIYVDESSAAAADLSTRFTDHAKSQKAKIEIALVPNTPKALRRERQIVTGDAETLDACAGWVNLVGKVVAGVAGAKVVRLQ